MADFVVTLCHERSNRIIEVEINNIPDDVDIAAYEALKTRLLPILWEVIRIDRVDHEPAP